MMHNTAINKRHTNQKISQNLQNWYKQVASSKNPDSITEI